MQIRHPFVWIGAAALAAAIAVPLLMTREEPPAPKKAAAQADLFPFVKSLQGTHPDGDIKVAAGDVLVVDAQLVDLFDYYLSAMGEKPLAAIRREIEQELERRLTPNAAGEAKRLLGNYIEYKTALVELDKNPQLGGNGLAAIRQRMEKMQELRARFFSPAESKGMFGSSDTEDMDTLARMEIGQDKSLSEAQKQAKLAALDAALPASVREARAAPLKIVKLEDNAAKMRQQGASEDDVYRMRAAALSPEAAARMAEVDQGEAAWKSRISAYLAERSKLSNADAIAELRNRMFDANEQKRLPAYEK
ncbi:lipase secretion chaperone [Collimonas fungivorans]|uniref:Lipase helper protein n=1 Tax=Collimonas fungivorans (strain Ter331) TaxID=1005048 RepID=G0ADA1_COLFT|nr:lipase secretion chaperone [Collimonas fungivorans]AEK63285.1 lipase modulator protein [Collimonas fungivorans Ter331]